MFLKVIVFSLFFTLYGNTFCYAHGLKINRVRGNSFGIEVRYENIGNTPASFSTVKIFSPAEKSKTENIFQEGLTDKHGRFYFQPDNAGVWKIEVNDGMGHGKIISFDVAEKVEFEKVNVYGFKLWHKFIIGISIIWGITGLLFYFSAKKYRGTD